MPNAVLEAPEQFSFRVSDGKVLRNIHELLNALHHMNEGTYHYHANAQKNDFANWVHDVLKDSKTAQSLRKTKTKAEAIKVLEKATKNIKK